MMGKHTMKPKETTNHNSLRQQCNQVDDNVAPEDDDSIGNCRIATSFAFRNPRFTKVQSNIFMSFYIIFAGLLPTILTSLSHLTFRDPPNDFNFGFQVEPVPEAGRPKSDFGKSNLKPSQATPARKDFTMDHHGPSKFQA